MAPMTDALLRFAESSLLFRQELRDAVEQVGGDPDVVSNPGFVVLLRSGGDEVLRPGDVANLTGLSSGGVTKLLDRLQDAGYITRRYGEVEGDARGVSIHRTAAGDKVVTRLSEVFGRRMAEFEVVIKELSDAIDGVD